MIILYILAWLAAGFVGSTILFYKDFYDDKESVTICQAMFRSLAGPYNFFIYFLVVVIPAIQDFYEYLDQNKRCTKIILKRK